MKTLRALCPALLLSLCACGGSAQPEPAAPKAEPAPAETAPAPAETAEAKAPDAPKPADDTTPEEPAKKPPLKGRDVTYRMTSAGLVIEVEGVEFQPKAEAVKNNASGGYDVALNVKATARDGQMHRLLSPENGPLMVAAKIERGGKATDVTDERKGDGEVFIAPDDSLNLERKVVAKVGPGATVTLQVGLWGLGLDADERKPVRKLFWLKMAGSAKKPTPVITAPE